MGVASVSYIFVAPVSAVRDIFIAVLAVDPGLTLSQSDGTVVLSSGQPSCEGAVRSALAQKGVSYQTTYVEAPTETPVEGSPEEEAVTEAESAPWEAPVAALAEETPRESEAAAPSEDAAPPMGEGWTAVVVKFKKGDPREMVNQSLRVLHALSGHMIVTEPPRWWGSTWCLYLKVASEALLQVALEPVDGCSATYTLR